jgi:hypothetical protein
MPEGIINGLIRRTIPFNQFAAAKYHDRMRLTNPSLVIKPMSARNASLIRLEDIIETSERWQMEAAKALLEIRDRQLYRNCHKSFDAYVRILLLEILNGVRGKVLLSSGDSDLYTRYLKDWRLCYRIRVPCGTGGTKVGRYATTYRTEILWANF